MYQIKFNDLLRLKLYTITFNTSKIYCILMDGTVYNCNLLCYVKWSTSLLTRFPIPTNLLFHCNMICSGNSQQGITRGTYLLSFLHWNHWLTLACRGAIHTVTLIDLFPRIHHSETCYFLSACRKIAQIKFVCIPGSGPWKFVWSSSESQSCRCRDHLSPSVSASLHQQQWMCQFGPHQHCEKEQDQCQQIICT